MTGSKFAHDASPTSQNRSPDCAWQQEGGSTRNEVCNHWAVRQMRHAALIANDCGDHFLHNNMRVYYYEPRHGVCGGGVGSPIAGWLGAEL